MSNQCPSIEPLKQWIQQEAISLSQLFESIQVAGTQVPASALYDAYRSYVTAVITLHITNGLTPTPTLLGRNRALSRLWLITPFIGDGEIYFASPLIEPIATVMQFGNISPNCITSSNAEIVVPYIYKYSALYVVPVSNNALFIEVLKAPDEEKVEDAVKNILGYIARYGTPIPAAMARPQLLGFTPVLTVLYYNQNGLQAASSKIPFSQIAGAISWIYEHEIAVVVR